MQPRKILAVDDSKLMLKMYEVLLRDYPLAFASDGVEAIECIERDADIDLVLLDINMPRLNGLEVLSELKSRDILGRLSIIIVSTEGEDEVIGQGLQAGAKAYITKPCQREQILGVISKLDGGKGA